MFRRKTDQIFDTLQAVQRRITEQGGAPPRPPVPAAPAVRPILPIGKARPTTEIPPPPPGPPPSPVRAAGPPPLSPPPAPPTLSPQSALARAATPTAYTPNPPGGPPPLITLSLSQVITVLIAWLGSLALVWVVAARSSDPIPPREPTSSGNAYQQQPAEFQPKRHIIVLTSVPSTEERSVKALQAQCEQLNEQMRRSKSGKYKPWFSVRPHPNGQTELIFGATEGQDGIDRSQPQWADFFRLLAAPAKDKGAGFSRAQWRPVN